MYCGGRKYTYICLVDVYLKIYIQDSPIEKLNRLIYKFELSPSCKRLITARHIYLRIMLLLKKLII